MRQILSMTTFRKKFNYPSFNELTRLHKLGIIKIQQSGFLSDSQNHHKIVSIQDLNKLKKILLNESQPTTTEEPQQKDESNVLVWIRPDIEQNLAYVKKHMLNIYVRDVPTGLFNRLKRSKQLLGCTSWVDFLHKTDEILEEELT